MRNNPMNNLKLTCLIIFSSVVITGCKDFKKQEVQSTTNASETIDHSSFNKLNEQLSVDMEKASHEALIKMDSRKAFRDEVELLCKGEVFWTKNFRYSTYIDKNNIKDSIRQNSQFVIGKGFYKLMMNGKDSFFFKQNSEANQTDGNGTGIYTVGVIDSFGNESELSLIENDNEPTKLKIINKDNTSILLYE